MAVVKWKFEDPADNNSATRTYTFEINPNQMGSPYPTRSTTTLGTTAVDGQYLMWEGMRQPAQMSFSGTILSYEQFMAFQHWCLQRRGRIYLHDHFGRRMTVVLHSFTPEPTRFTGRYYWRHSYTIDCTVVAVGAPTVTNNYTDG